MQSHYRVVARLEIFMEQELRFGMDLGWIWDGFGPVGITKKKRPVFSCFYRQKK